MDFACKRIELEDVILCSLSISKGESKIMYFLMNNSEKSFTSKRISKELKIDLSTAQRALKRLNDKNIILRLQSNLKNGGYIYVYQIKDKEIIKNMIDNVINQWVKNVKLSLDKW